MDKKRYNNGTISQYGWMTNSKLILLFCVWNTTYVHKSLSKHKAIIFCLIYKIRNKNKIICGKHINVRL